jgi:hypothetical protein
MRIVAQVLEGPGDREKPERVPHPPHSMIDREIRAMLRGATAAKFLHGWQGPHLAERTYCLTPKHADPMERPLDYVIGYCEMLAVAGVRPLYRESDPVL